MAILRLFLAGIFLLASSVALYADEPAFCPLRPDWVSPNAPELYVVKHGDTIWDVARTFLCEPWRWGEALCMDVADPDPNLIYPGDQLSMEYCDGKPQIKLKRGKYWEKVDSRTGVVKLSPRARTVPADNPIPTIAINVIRPFFNHSRVLNKNQAYYVPCIVALDEDHIIVGKGDRIYVTGISSNIPDDVYTVVRPGKEYVDPCTRRCIGIEGYVLGTAEREVIGDPSRWILTESYAEVNVGDRLIATLDEELDPFFVPKFPHEPSEGQVISVFDGMNQLGRYQVVVVTGGVDRCREIGDVLGVFQIEKDLPSGFMFSFERKYEYPPMRVGNLVVFRVFDFVSYALVMDATRTIYLQDYVGSP
jgi:hypothetical protein